MIKMRTNEEIARAKAILTKDKEEAIASGIDYAFVCAAMCLDVLNWVTGGVDTPFERNILATAEGDYNDNALKTQDNTEVAN